jgi:hypothetical protein
VHAHRPREQVRGRHQHTRGRGPLARHPETGWRSSATLSLSLSLPAHAYLHALRAPSMKASSACTHRVACRTPCVGRAPGTTTRARAARPRRVNMPGDTTATLPTRHRLMRASKGPN